MEAPSNLSVKKRNWKATLRVGIAFFLLLVFVAAGSVGAWYATSMIKPGGRIAARETRPAAQAVAASTPLDEALRQHPQDKSLQLMAMAARVANESDATFEKWSSEIEPPSIAKGVNPAATSRSDLEALQRDLKTAETNANALLPRYTALLKTERDKVEKDSRASSAGKEAITQLLDSVDKHHAEITALTAKLLSARADYYRAYGNYVAVLAGAFGSYRVVDGQLIFPLQGTVDRYDMAAHAMTDAAKRVAALQGERKGLVKAQQEGWEKVVGGK